jgi:Ca-activated chloride channel family protein
MKIVINPIRPALSIDSQDFHILIRLQSEFKEEFKRTPINLVLVVDRSGSMEGAKLSEAKRCVIDLIKRMNPKDKVGVVQYDDQVDTVLPLSPVEQVSSILEPLIQGITANGSTSLHAGWLRGSEMLAPHAGRDATCHVILISDGLANHGLIDKARICEQVIALASAGVTTSTVGLGADFNEELMTSMAHAGQGSAHYGERAVDLAETFDAEIGLLSHLQWRNVEISIPHSPNSLEILNSYQQTENGWRLPSIAMGSECWALLRMSMQDAIRIQRMYGTALEIKVNALDPSGNRFNFDFRMQNLPIVSETEYLSKQLHELVDRRINELTAAQLQLQIREAALSSNWHHVELLLTQLENLGRNEPWVAASIAFTRKLMRERDERRMSKEMLYKSQKMRQRLSSTDELMYSAQADLESPAFLRRKATEGRRTET